MDVQTIPSRWLQIWKGKLSFLKDGWSVQDELNNEGVVFLVGGNAEYRGCVFGVWYLPNEGSCQWELSHSVFPCLR